MTPVPQAETGGRDPTTGRFLPGSSGNPAGRPARPSAVRIAAEAAQERGTTLERELGGVFDVLFEKAKGGCVQSARLLLDALVEKDPIAIETTVHDTAYYVNMSEAERGARIRHLLEVAEQRRAAAEAAEQNGKADDA